MADVIELGKRVKAKYPESEYSKMSDLEVGRKVKAKYPEYSDFVDVADSPNPAPPKDPEPQKSLIGSTIEGINNRVVGAAQDLLGGVGKAINPMELVQSAGQMVTSPLVTGRALLENQGRVLSEGAQQMGQGNLIRGGRKLAAGMIPLVGPAIDAIADKAESGELASAIGEGIGMAGSMFIPMKLPKSIKVVKPAMTSPQRSGMMQMAQERGIPLSAADVSDNAFVRGAQQVGSSTIAGGPVAAAARAQQANALRRVAGELMDEVGEGATKESAISSAKSQVTSTAADLAGDSQLSYRRLYDIEKKLGGETREVIEAVEPVTGAPVKSQIPAMSVDVRALKQWAAETLSGLKARYAAADPQQAQIIGQQIKSLESIAKGPNFKGLATADKDLSNIKALMRNSDGATESTLRGTEIMDRLSREIDNTVANVGGPEATKALAEGRAAWAKMSELQDLAKRFQEEPIRAFSEITASKDASIGLMREIAQAAPESMPKIGRAWLEKTFEKALSDGDGVFTGGKGLAQQWQTLGPETKKLLFKDPALRTNLDNFFRLVKRIDNPINTSGTAPAAVAGRAFDLAGAAIAGSGDVLSALATQVGAGGLTALMYNPKFVSALNRGLSAPVQSPARAAALTQMMRIAEATERSRPPQTELQPVGVTP